MPASQDKHYILKDLTGTQQSDFKLGEHVITSTADAVVIADKQWKIDILKVSPAKLQISEIAFYWGNAPLTTGKHNAGDIVWNIDQDNPDHILCWRCVETGAPGTWQAQYTDPLQLPKTAAANSIAQYKDGWQAVEIELVVISADQVTPTNDKNFVSSQQLQQLINTSGRNTGDETRNSILDKLGAVSNSQHGYLTNTDYNRLQAAYDISTELVNNPADLGIPTKLSDLADDLNIATVQDLPTAVSQLKNDVGYVTAAALPTTLGELNNDVGYITTNALPINVTELSNDAGYITVEDLNKLHLHSLKDVDLNSNRLSDGYVLTYKAYLDKWIPFKVESVTAINGVKADHGVISLTTTNIPEGSNQYFTAERARQWADTYIPTVPLRKLQDVDIDDNEEGTLLYFTDSAWRARRLQDITLFNIDNLTDVVINTSIRDFDVFTYNNGVWSNISFTQNPNFTLGLLRDTRVIDPKEGEVLVYDENNRLWVNRAATTNVDGGLNSDLSLNDLTDVAFVNAGLQDGAVLTYNASDGVWYSSLLSAAVSSVNDKTGAVTLTTADIPEAGGNLYFNSERFDERISQLVNSIDLISLAVGGTPVVGSVLYYDGGGWSAGVASDLNLTTGDLSDFNLTNLSNGDLLVNKNGYWVGIPFPELLLGINTDDIPEGQTNLYYTNQRVATYLTTTATNVIPTAAIQDDAVTLSKITNISNNTFLGNISGAPASPTELYFGDGFELNLATNTISVGASNINDLYLDDLVDVVIDYPVDSGSLLGWDAITQKWEPIIIQTVVSINGLDGIVSLTTTSVPEGTNLYFTNTRADARIAAAKIDDLADVDKTGWLVGKAWGFNAQGNTVPVDLAAINSVALVDLLDVNISNPADQSTIIWDDATNKFIAGPLNTLENTDALPEGINNLYFKTSRVDARVSQLSINQLNDVNTAGWAPAKVLGFNSSGYIVPLNNVLPSTTSDLPEGTNLYYTSARVDARLSQLSINQLSDVNIAGWTGGQVLGFNGSGVLTPVDVLTTSTNTDSIPPGTSPTRQYYSNAQVESYLATIGLNKIAGAGGIGGAAPIGGQALVYNETTQRYEPGAVGVLTINLSYSSPGDANGLVYWCGSEQRRTTFTTPANKTAPYNLNVILSSNPSGQPTSGAIDRNSATLVQTASESNARLILDLNNDKLIKPNYYTIRGRSDTNTRHPRSWKLQGSMDGSSNWIDLDSQINNTSISQNTYFAGACTSLQSFRYISLLLTGLDSSGTEYLTVADFELYGSLSISGASSATTADDLPEGGANLYYSDARVQTYLNGGAAIPGSKINDNSLTLAKLPQVAQNRLLGRYTASTGNVETILLGTGFSFSGSTLNIDASVIGGVTSVVGQTGIVTAAQIATGLNALTGTDRVDYLALKNLPATVTSSWGNITGTLANQTDLQTALNAKFSNPTGTTSQYLRGDGTPATFPAIPTAVSQLTNDSGYLTSASLASYATQSWVTSQNYLTSVSWAAVTGKPTFATVATSGSYTDLINKPVTAVPFGGFIEVIINKTYPLFKPDRSYKILSLRVKSLSGTCTWAIQINGVSVTGLSAVSVTSTEQLISATGANTIAAGERATIVSTANSSALDVEFTIMLEVI